MKENNQVFTTDPRITQSKLFSTEPLPKIYYDFRAQDRKKRKVLADEQSIRQDQKQYQTSER